MVKVPRLGVYLHHTHYTDGEYTVTNSEALSFIQRAGLGEKIMLAVSVVKDPGIDASHYQVVAEKRGIRVLRLPGWRSISESFLKIPFSLKKVLRVSRELVKNSDLIWLRVPSIAAFFIWWLAYRSKTPVIIHVAGNILLAARPTKYRGIALAGAWLLSRMVHILTRLMCRYGVVLTAGGQLKELLSRPLHPAYMFDDFLVSGNEFLPPKKTRGDAKTLLFVGRIDHGKGAEILINVIDGLRGEFPSIKLKMAGDGPLFNAIKRMVEEKRLEDHVQLLGFVPAKGPLEKLYRESDISVLPSDSYPEGFPRVILEAWAAGLPVVVTRLAGIPYRITHGVNGMIVDPGNEEQLKQALRSLIIDEELRFQIALGGSRAVSRLSFEKQKSLVESLLLWRYPRLAGLKSC